MNRTTVYAKTAKGAQAETAPDELARDLGNILNAIDGMSSVEDLRGKLDYLSAVELDEALATLAAKDFIHEVSSSTPEYQRKAQELRDKLRARRQGAERSTSAADASVPPSQEQARRDDEERVRLEAEARARRDAEEESRRKAEEEAGRKAAERARQEAEELTRREAEERVRQEAEARARRDAEEEARRKAEEEVGRKAAERARQEAEAQARLMAEEQARFEAEDKIRREEEVEARRLANVKAASPGKKSGSRTPRKWGKALALGLVVLVAVTLVMIHLISFDGQIPQFEKTLAGQFQQPVKIRALHLSLVPQPHLRLEGVSIGSEGQIRVSRINAAGDLGNLFSDKKVFKSIELDSPVVTEEGLGWILLGKALGRDMVFGQVSALNASLESKNGSLPAFDAKLQFDGEGAWQTIALESMDKNLSLDLVPKGPSVQFDVKARSFKIPFGSALTLDEMVAKGTADRSGLSLTEFKGFAYGGTLSGNASLKWGANWSLSGELNAKQIDTARLVPELMDGGRLEGKAAYVLQAPEATKLFAAPHLEGNFVIPRGTLLGVDLGSVLQGGRARGDTKFTDLTGSFVHDRGATQLRQVHLVEGAMSASGMVDVDADNSVRGRLAADMKLSAEHLRANFAISGTLKKFEWRRQ
jgi:TolA protein